MIKLTTINYPESTIYLNLFYIMSMVKDYNNSLHTKITLTNGKTITVLENPETIINFIKEDR